MKLHIHPNGLQRWRDKFLDEISALLNFELPDSDIFSRNKIEAIICVLERIVTFFESHHLQSTNFLNNIKLKLNYYNKLLFCINYFLELDPIFVGDCIIKSKILNQNMSLKELEQCTGYSRTTISHYINLFKIKYVHI